MLNRLICLYFLLLFHLTATAQIFDTRFSNSSKVLLLQGRVREITTRLYNNGKQRDTTKKVLWAVIVQKFNHQGNLSERTQYLADGRLAARDVYTYENGQISAHIYYNKDSLKPALVTKCKVNLKENTITTEAFSRDSDQVFFTKTYKYDAKGRLISMTSYERSGKKDVTTYTYNALKNSVINRSTYSKSYFIQYYDKNQFQIGWDIFNDKGYPETQYYFLNDKFGNHVEYGTYDQMRKRHTVHTTVYSYDKRNNWLTMKNIDGRSTRWEERNILYY
ncbi:hypothetical protein HDC92_002712 [Pedobacter sp. AK017]|uniref:hypothetical protein n=1 Tax=Pedobacter sp. AK017 TaxID=2723073 RepID=UPI00160C45E9|nr:hypothetical protein [Pedobacter sp. AK017]MBB5439028.1 hypothetical protein [Pedobacter sp. AK017]